MENINLVFFPEIELAGFHIGIINLKVRYTVYFMCAEQFSSIR